GVVLSAPERVVDPASRNWWRLLPGPLLLPTPNDMRRHYLAGLAAQAAMLPTIAAFSSATSKSEQRTDTIGPMFSASGPGAHSYGGRTCLVTCERPSFMAGLVSA